MSEALLPFAQRGVRCHYLANIDGSEFHELVAKLRAETTLFIVSSKSFDALYAELAVKAKERPEGSGTVAQLDAGIHAIGKKIVEEAAEVWMAAEYQSDDEAAEEISQLLYHLQVMMLAKGISPEDVYRHL